MQNHLTKLIAETNQDQKAAKHAIPRDLGKIFLEQERPGLQLTGFSDSEQWKDVCNHHCVTIPFEGNLDALNEAREAKIEKYSNLTGSKSFRVNSLSKKQ